MATGINNAGVLAIEPSTDIAGLDATAPVGVEAFSEGDDHIRLIKRVLKNVFRGLNDTGFTEVITANETELNLLQGLTSNVQQQLDAIKAQEVPIGGIVYYDGVIDQIPPNYAICDGTNGTPDLQGLFVYGGLGEGDIGTVGGFADTQISYHQHPAPHDHIGTSSTDSHRHAISSRSLSGNTAVSDTVFADRITPWSTTLLKIMAGGAHSHSPIIDDDSTTTGSTGVSSTGTNLPPYITLAVIQRIT